MIGALRRPSLRSAAADELADLGSREAVPGLVELLQRQDALARADVASALGRIGDARAADALEQALSDDDLDVQWSAHRALQMLGDEYAPADPFATAERELMEAVAQSARAALEAHAATLTSKPSEGPAPAVFELEPRNPRACAVHVQADSVQQVSLFLGPHGTWWEVWDDDRDSLVGWVRDTVGGIVAGRYEEWVAPGEYRQARGILHVPGGEDRTIDNNILLRTRLEGWEHLTYEPYL